MVLGLVSAKRMIPVITTTIARVTISPIFRIMNTPYRPGGLGIESIVQAVREG